MSTISFMSPLTIDFYNCVYDGEVPIDIMQFFERISEKTSMLKSGTLSINEVIIGGGGTFVGRHSDNFSAKWSADKGWSVQREEPGLWRHASMYGTFGSTHRTCLVVAYATGAVRVSIGPKRDLVTNKNANNAAAEIREQTIPRLVRDALDLLGVNAPANPRIRPVNASATGSIRRAFTIPWGRDQNADVVGNTVQYELSRYQRPGITVVTTQDVQPPYPIRFGFYRKQTRDDLAKWFSGWYGQPTSDGADVVWFTNVTLTAAGAKKFPDVAKFKKRPPKQLDVPIGIRTGFAVDAKVDFRSGDIKFTTNRGTMGVAEYPGAIEPVRIARMQIRRTGYVQITGSIDLPDMFAMYAVLERVVSIYREWFSETVVNRVSPSRRGAAGRRAGEPQRRGRKDGSTCKPPIRLPVPNTFEGLCRDEATGNISDKMHIRPTPAGHPCCFKDRANTTAFRQSIAKAYARAGVPIPESVRTKFGITNVPNNRLTAKKVGLDAKGRLLIDRKLCRSMPAKSLEDVAAAMGIALTEERGGRQHKLKKEDLCREIQSQRIFDMIRLENDVLYVLDVPCTDRDDAYLRTYMTGLGIDIPGGVAPCAYMMGWFKVMQNAANNNNANAQRSANNNANARPAKNNAQRPANNNNAHRPASFNFEKMLENAIREAAEEEAAAAARPSSQSRRSQNFRLLDNFFG